MLTSLSIRDIVLIDRLALRFSDGLNVLTGETGAGKSILLDSLGLALGTRADRALVRRNQEKGTVSACFTVAKSHIVCSKLDDAGLDHGDGEIVLRRQITADGRSKAWINDQPVGQALLAEVGACLVEIHGQHDDRGLLDASAHRNLLDEFAGLASLKADMSRAYSAYQAALKEEARIKAEIAEARVDEEYIRHAAEELAALAPEEGEEQILADRRALMMQGEKSAQELADFQKTLTAHGGVDATVRGVIRRMARLDGALAERLTTTFEALDRAADELAVATDALGRVIADVHFDGQELEQVEERLFEFHRIARKHNCQPAELLSLGQGLSAKLDTITGSEDVLRAATQLVHDTRESFHALVKSVSSERRKISEQLDLQVNNELPALKLEKAIFKTDLEALPVEQWNELGGERVVFQVKTNEGTPFGPMVKVASGGELARFILALKVVLAKNTSVPVMVFDEVDRGIGGATASAVGDRLKKLTVRSQVLVVTHSPQVAARGDIQFQISKDDIDGDTKTSVGELSDVERKEEIARMLAGAEITDAARAAADQLLNSGDSA
ncbi:DNA repair protein RecN [Kordiimonas aquimaris]|uniref:DNA repair protein RecN n=1 Tax=Kordiimonas aquimaris TaxID=707591 RepID=UPI0021D287B7|nr:DNA repair protein RecN [Kordiimonas aquimaris]